jgi:2-polyprenyl-3-methyl-5-hydroxy-6-metoxy-1,4-benzoquinol methylase
MALIPSATSSKVRWFVVDLRFDFDPTSVFDSVATEYRNARPSYPDVLYNIVAELVGGLAGKAVADVGAGTGIATSALAARGASVVAVEPSRAMLGARSRR